jgi:hypothetical protein
MSLILLKLGMIKFAESHLCTQTISMSEWPSVWVELGMRDRQYVKLEYYHYRTLTFVGQQMKTYFRNIKSNVMYRMIGVSSRALVHFFHKQLHDLKADHTINRTLHESRNTFSMHFIKYSVGCKIFHLATNLSKLCLTSNTLIYCKCANLQERQ